jgi:hypothetical protein
MLCSYDTGSRQANVITDDGPDVVARIATLSANTGAVATVLSKRPKAIIVGNLYLIRAT